MLELQAQNYACKDFQPFHVKDRASSQLHVKLFGNASGNRIDTSQQLMHSDLYMEIWTRTKEVLS